MITLVSKKGVMPVVATRSIVVKAKLSLMEGVRPICLVGSAIDSEVLTGMNIM